MSTHVTSPAPSGLPEGLADHSLLTSDEAALLPAVEVAAWLHRSAETLNEYEEPYTGDLARERLLQRRRATAPSMAAEGL